LTSLPEKRNFSGKEETLTDRKETFREPNAFDSDFLESHGLRDQPPHPEASSEGPWRVVRVHGAPPNTPRWACWARGEAEPRVVVDREDLAHRVAAALALSDRLPRYRVEEGPEGRLHLLENGRVVGTLHGWSDDLPRLLTALTDLQLRPLPFAHFLASTGEETLLRAGRIVYGLVDGDSSGDGTGRAS
jgi:hypothetical protein